MACIKRDVIVMAGRKGMTHEIFFSVFELVLAAVVLLALWFFVHDVASQTIFERNYLARDIALMLNAIYAAPGNVEYTYSAGITGLTLDFTGNKVEVKSSDSADSEIAFYPFAKNDLLSFQYSTLEYGTGSVRIRLFKSAEAAGVEKSQHG